MCERDMRAIAPTVCRVLGVRPPSSAESPPLGEVVETMGPTERLAVVVLDAFGVSTWEAARGAAPSFDALASRHLGAISSVMPTITPVNFATMLTGAHPERHMIRERTQPLGLETVFHVLRERGRTSATAARALSSLGILISPLADRPGIAESNTDEEVTEIAVEALRGRADLLWVQLLDIDDAGHLHGPLSPEGMEAVREADGNLRRIAEAAHREGYGLIALADHGQHTRTGEDGNPKGWHGTEREEDVRVPLVWSGNYELGEALGLG